MDQALHLHNPDALPVGPDSIEQSARDILVGRRIVRWPLAAEIFLWLWRKLSGKPGGPIVIEPSEVCLAVAAKNRQAVDNALKVLQRKQLITIAKRRYQRGPIEIYVLEAAPAEQQQRLPGTEPPARTHGVRVVADRDAAELQAPIANGACNSEVQRDSRLPPNQARIATANCNSRLQLPTGGEGATEPENSPPTETVAPTDVAGDLADAVDAPPAKPARGVQRADARPLPRTRYISSSSSSPDPDPESYPDPSRLDPMHVSAGIHAALDRLASPERAQAAIDELTEWVLRTMADAKLSSALVQHVATFAIRETACDGHPDFDAGEVRRMVRAALDDGDVPRKYLIGTFRREFEKREWPWPFRRRPREPP